MGKETLKFVIVGHVDHGKSTLIGRLLYDTDSLPEGKIEEIKQICEMLGRDLEFGFILDNLEEERDQGITIDTTQTWFRTPNRDYVIIDAPGHVEFVKNMITGASQAEAAILIVDVNEGVQEQTKRHSYILSMLGLKQVIVVINKMDLVNYNKKRFEEVKENLLSFLKDINIVPSEIIPISAKEGHNVAKKSEKMKWYSGPTVLEALSKFKTHKENVEKPLRFAVQDVYKREKRIIVGMVESGILKVGEDVVVLPSKEITKIKSIEEFMKENVLEAQAGKATGIVTENKVFVDRGNIICEPNQLPKITNSFKAHVFWMSKDPLKNKERLNLKLSTQESAVSVELIKIWDSSSLKEIKNKDQLENRQVAEVLIKSDKPIVIENFNNIEELGRFVLERLNICAGGIITENGG